MMHNMDKYRSGLWHLAGSASVACVAGVATVGLIGAAFNQGQAAAVFFAVFTGSTAYWMAYFCMATGSELLSIYRSAYSRAEDMNRENLSLRKRLMSVHLQRAEGEADGAGGTVPSANVRFLVPPPKRVN
jgi:hypothetical protein